MNINDYLIAHYDFDWASILTDWHWLFPTEFRVWLMNKFGDLILITNDEAIHFFDVGNAALEKVAENKDDFCQQLDTEETANNWLLIPLIDKLMTVEKNLTKGRCYSYLTLPFLGGEYTVENTVTLPIAEHYSVIASIYDQIKDLPAGTKVQMTVINVPQKQT